jgi:hypothetical protein
VVGDQLGGVVAFIFALLDPGRGQLVFRCPVGAAKL